MFVHLRRSNTMMHCIRKPSEPAFCGGFLLSDAGYPKASPDGFRRRLFALFHS